MGVLQPGHLIVILAIVLIIFGPGKLADLGKSLGEGLRELKKAADPNPGDHSPSGTVATAPPSAATRTCPNCSGAVPMNDKFCGHCGTTLAA
jgi:sec-independent protein translocase protein TatA